MKANALGFALAAVCMTAAQQLARRELWEVVERVEKKK